MGWGWFKSHYNHRKKPPHESWLLYFLLSCIDLVTEGVKLFLFLLSPLAIYGRSPTVKQSRSTSRVSSATACAQSSRGRAKGNGLLSQELWQLMAVGIRESIGALEQVPLTAPQHRAGQVLSRTLSL